MSKCGCGLDCPAYRLVKSELVLSDRAPPASFYTAVTMVTQELVCRSMFLLQTSFSVIGFKNLVKAGEAIMLTW